MNKYKYKYQIDDPIFREFAFDLETDLDHDCLELVSELAADDFHSNHNGWDEHWPCDIYIFDLDGKLMGDFVVQRYVQPIFTSKKIVRR